jgi:PleD family two-component response regulator
MGNLIRCKCSLCGKVLLLDEALPEKEQTCPECGKESVVLQADGPPALAPAPNLAGKKILLVDDDREFLNLMRVRLRPTGCAMITAMDGMTATAMLRKEQPDLVLLDLGLPGALSFWKDGPTGPSSRPSS